MTKVGFRRLVDRCRGPLQSPQDNRAPNLTPEMKLAIYLDFVRSDSFQRVVGKQVRLCLQNLFL